MLVLDTLEQGKQELMASHLDYVIEANKKVNLTRIDTREEGVLLHIEDSLAGLTELNDAPAGLYGDLGSGAGYPGIPLAIATGRKTVLIDARQKKMQVMDGIIAKLGLQEQVSTFAGRAELLARTQAKRYAVLTARALAKLPVLMELASPLLMRGGRLVCYKARIEDEELAHAMRVRKPTGMEVVSDRSFLLGEDVHRRIITFEKVAESAVKLPRQEGLAQKKPLG